MIEERISPKNEDWQNVMMEREDMIGIGICN